MNRFATKTDSNRKTESALQTKQPLAEHVYMTDSYHEVMSRIKDMNRAIRGKSYDFSGADPNMKRAIKSLVSTLSKIEARGMMDKVKDLSPIIKELGGFLTDNDMEEAHPEIMRVLGLVLDVSAVPYLLQISDHGPEGNRNAIKLLYKIRTAHKGEFDEEFASALQFKNDSMAGALYAFNRLYMSDSPEAMVELLNLRDADGVNDNFRNEVTSVFLNALLRRDHPNMYPPVKS